MEFQTRDIPVGETTAHVWHGGEGYPIFLMHGAGPGTTAMIDRDQWRTSVDPVDCFSDRIHGVGFNKVNLGQQQDVGNRDLLTRLIVVDQLLMSVNRVYHRNHSVHSKVWGERIVSDDHSQDRYGIGEACGFDQNPIEWGDLS
tara:strand:- start:641 stop:1069 length:429 start_codon:yes stop_codon:yes gene_type:complete